MSNWTDEQKQEIIAKYQDAEPTAANSMEIVKEIAEEGGFSPNAVRMILSQAGVYVKKVAAGTTKTVASGDKPARVGKEAAHSRLTAAMSDAGVSVDSEIISKLTGKAAVYFAEAFESLNNK